MNNNKERDILKSKVNSEDQQLNDFLTKSGTAIIAGIADGFRDYLEEHKIQITPEKLYKGAKSLYKDLLNDKNNKF